MYRLEDDPKYQALLAMVANMQGAIVTLMAKVDSLEARGCGEESPKDEPKAIDPIGDAWGSMMDEPKAPAPIDPVGDAWGSMMDEPKAPAKPKSTLVLGPKAPKAPKASKTPAHDRPGNNGKVPVDTIIAIQTAWKNTTATQAELAVKYGMDDKKVWYVCNRAKQLV